MYSNISPKDPFFGNEIDQDMNEYNLNKNFYGSKMKYINRNQPNFFNSNMLYNINSNNIMSSPYNDLDLQNRITNSLYVKRNNNFSAKKKYTPSSISSSLSKNSFPSNFNFNNNYSIRKPLYNNNLIDDFRTTLMQTQAIKNKILATNNNININYNLNTDIENSDISDSLSNSDNSGISEENVGSINSDEISDISNGINIETEDLKYKYKNDFNNGLKNDLNYKREKEKEMLQINKADEDKLKLSNQVLKKSNQDLRNQNRILEVEITNYKTQENNLKANSKVVTHFDENLQSFMTSVKNKLKESVSKNLELMDNIFSLQKENQTAYSKNKKLGEEHVKVAAKIEEENRKKAEAQIMNEENEKKISTLNEEKINLNNDMEKMKIELLNLQNTEKNLKILKESNMKRQKDKEELLNKLNATLEQLNKEKQSADEKTKLNNKQNENAKNMLNSYEKQIAELKNKIDKLTKDQQNFIEINANMNVELKTGNNNINKETAKKEKELKEELNKIKLENEKIQNIIAEKELKIQTLKDYFDKYDSLLKNGGSQEEIKKLNIKEIVKENEEEEKEEKNILNNRYDEEIKNAVNEKLLKDNEIVESQKKYQEIERQKDEIINALEKQINSSGNNIGDIPMPMLENQLKNGNLKSKNANNINNDINNQLMINSIKELNLDSENADLNDQNQNLINNEINDNFDELDNNNYNNINEYNIEDNNYNITDEGKDNLNYMNANMGMNMNMNMPEGYQQFQDEQDYGEEQIGEGEEEYYNNNFANNEINGLNDLDANYEEQGEENEFQNEDEYNQYLLQQQYMNQNMNGDEMGEEQYNEEMGEEQYNEEMGEEQYNEEMGEEQYNEEMGEEQYNEEMGEGMNQYMGNIGEEMNEDMREEGEEDMGEMDDGVNHEFEGQGINDINELDI